MDLNQYDWLMPVAPFQPVKKCLSAKLVPGAVDGCFSNPLVEPEVETSGVKLRPSYPGG
jgi:hypothetical protein